MLCCSLTLKMGCCSCECYTRCTIQCWRTHFIYPFSHFYYKSHCPIVFIFTLPHPNNIRAETWICQPNAEPETWIIYWILLGRLSPVHLQCSLSDTEGQQHHNPRLCVSSVQLLQVWAIASHEWVFISLKPVFLYNMLGSYPKKAFLLIDWSTLKV